MLERFQGSCITISSCTVTTLSLHFETDFMWGIRTQITVFVYHSHCYKRKIFSIRFDYITIGYQFNMIRFTGCMEFFFSYSFPVSIISHDFHRAWLIFCIHPHQAVTALTFQVHDGNRVSTIINGYGKVFGTFPLALSVDEQFGWRIVSIYKDRSYLSLSSFPIPVRKNVKCFLFFIPVTTIEIITVFGQPC